MLLRGRNVNPKLYRFLFVVPQADDLEGLLKDVEYDGHPIALQLLVRLFD